MRIPRCAVWTRLLFILILLLTTAAFTKAQEFGGNPPSIKWDQVNIPAAKIIFPKGLDSSAYAAASIIARMNYVIGPTIGTKQKQISIVLQNQTTVANAYVGLAPFRSEFYLTPEQNSFDIGSLPWVDQLAIHEFRHVQQYNNFNVGFSHFLRILFGEGGQALGNDLAIPNWFFEGDAVFNETLVSRQGRGRLPWFFNGYRALWDAGKNYSWMKLRNGSYLDYTPDWYPTGYMLVSYGREKYGDDFWRKVTHDAAAYKGVVYPLQHAIKKYSGENFETFRNDAFNYYKKQFGINLQGLPSQGFEHSPEHFVADEEYPAYVNDSTMVFMKSTYDHRPVFVMRTGAHERNISVRSISLDNYFAYHDWKIVYTAYRPDLRWTYRDYSEIELLDVKTGKEHRITKNSKYFSPDFSADGKTIVAVQEAPNGKCNIHLLNTDGSLRHIVPNPDKLFFTYPKFYNGGTIISAVRTTNGQMSLAEIDIQTGKVKYLTKPSYQPIAFPVIKGDWVYYSRTGTVDELYAYDLANGKQYWLPNPDNRGAIGYYEPAIANDKFAWVGFTATGYKINEVNNKNVEWLEVKETNGPAVLPEMGLTALHRDSAADLLDRVKVEPLAITKYPKTYHLFNFHSIIPTINDPDYSIAIIGENVLNTFQSQLSLGYNRDEGYKDFGFDAVYGAWFPFVRVGLDYLYDRRAYANGHHVYWNETDPHAGFEFPLNFSQGRQITGLDFGTDVYYSRADFQPPYNKSYKGNSYTYLNNYIVFSNQIQQAKQNIYPRFAQSLTLNFKTAVTGLTANQFLASANLYFPGLSVNHNLIFNLAHQQNNDENVVGYTNNFPFARGYVAENLRNMNKAGVDYHFPLIYPDAGVANTLYFLRLRGDVFYDFTRVSDNFSDGSAYKNFRSTGVAIFFDTQWFNQVPISFGIRYDYLLDPDLFGGTGRNRIELVLPIAVLN
ncbi:MAG: PQQ-binding-like beta-propeller repeat protein [Bacteroidetes bacterium]|nr:PQQ-binding-like beta-propeller repeat protein [Bacteroidota bacterium]